MPVPSIAPEPVGSDWQFAKAFAAGSQTLVEPLTDKKPSVGFLMIQSENGSDATFSVGTDPVKAPANVIPVTNVADGEPFQVSILAGERSDGLYGAFDAGLYIVTTGGDVSVTAKGGRVSRAGAR